MADPSTGHSLPVPTESAPRPNDRYLPISRRILLGSAVGASAAVATGLRPAAADTAHAPTDTSPDRHTFFRAYHGSLLRHGHQDGTVLTHDGVRIQHPTGRRSYTDPYGDDDTVVRYETATWTSPVVHTPFGYTELISSWQVDTPGRSWVEVRVRGTDEKGKRTGWFVLGRWCAKDPADGGAIHRTTVDDQKTDVATVYADTLHVFDPHTLADWQIRVTLLRPEDAEETPVVHSVGAVASKLPSDKTVEVSKPGRAGGRVLPVPTLSQEVHKGHYPKWDNGGEAWCSPTSTAMVVKYWHTGPHGHDLDWVDPPDDPEVDFAARNVFDYAYGGAGNWSFNTAYAGRYGLHGIVTRLRSFTELEELTRVGIPVIISVSFAKKDLDGAGYGTNGHLMVVVGFTKDGDVVVNDPASHLIPDNDEVRTTYRRDQLENAWVPHSGGTVYVIAPRTLPRPPVSGEPNW